MSTGDRVSATEKELGTQEGLAGSSPIPRVPTKKPPFTVSQLKSSIPPHCFRRSLIRSLYYLSVDLAFVVLFLYIALVYIPTLPSPLHVIAWPLYWACQGCVMTGIWMIGHDCGHNSFSNYALLDDLVGFVIHSALLVPYFSWKYSHRRHHSNIGSVERDEVYVPRHKAGAPWYVRYLNSTLGRIAFLAVLVTIGWPLYLTINFMGRPYDSFASHFYPNSPIYSDKERTQVLISDAGVLVACYGLYKLAAAYGLWWLVRVYGVPLFVTNSLFITITYLHHTHPALPHYLSSEWDWLRGALTTVDRDYGFFNHVFNNVTASHVVHHIFSSIPHYHTVEATRAIKPLLGDYYCYDATPVAKAIWREVNECLYVEPDDGDNAKSGGILWYKNKY